MPKRSDLDPLVVRLGAYDNVVTALHDIAPGAYTLAGQAVAVGEPIPAGHKLSIAPIAAGEVVLKYNSPIGVATRAIPAGAWVHTHNLSSIRSPRRQEETAP